MNAEVVNGKLIIPEGTLIIDDFAYYGQKDIESVVLPESLEAVGNGAFSGCVGIKDISFGAGLSRIGDGAFFGCTSLKEVSLPESVCEIGEHAFTSCTSIERVSLPASVVSIGKGVFQGCTALSEITSAGEGNYYSKDGVLFRRMEDGAALYVFPQGRSGDYKTPAGVTRIDPSAFRGCSRLDKVILSEDIAYIGDMAFAGCRDIFIEVENRDIEFGMLPFDETANVSFAESKKKKNPFTGFGEVDFEEKLASIKYIMPVHKKFVVPKDKWSTEDNEDGIRITSYNGDETEITTPSRLSEKTVNAIGDYAFSPEKGGIDRRRRELLSQIRSVFLARDIKELGTGVFKNCTSLEYVLVPNSVDRIGDRAFSGCSSLSADHGDGP